MLTPTADNPADPHAATTAGRSLQGSQEPNDPRDNGHSKIKPWITPGTGKTYLSIALAVQAARRGHRVAFATAHQWVNRLVHHAEIVSLKGDSYRLKDRRKEVASAE